MKKAIFTAWIITLTCMLPLSCLATEEKELLFPSKGYTYSINDDGTVTIRRGPDSSETPLVIPGELDGRQVTKIGENAFYDRDMLTSVEIPSSVTTIERYAFLFCNNLASIEIPSSVIEIGVSAFTGCKNLTNVTLPPSLTTLGGCSCSSCEKLTNVEISSSVTKIGEGAFVGCKKFEQDHTFPRQ